MNAIRRIAMGIGGTVVVALFFSLVAPKTVHALVSALVTVSNTTANPVPTTDVMRSVAQNVELHCLLGLNGAPSCVLIPPTGQIGSDTQYVVPSGSNLVITDVELSAPQSGGTVGFLLLSTILPNSQRIEDWIVPGDGTTHEFESPSGIVIPPGATLTLASDQQLSLLIIRGYLTAN